MEKEYELGNIEKFIIDSKLNSLIHKCDEYKYIKQEDFDKLNLNEEAKNFIEVLLDRNNIFLEEDLEKEIPEYLWTTEKQTEMFTEYNKTHDRELLNKIFESNLPFAKFMAYKLSYMYDDQKEAEITAQEGLFLAIQKYDVEKGVRFTTYASRCIKSYMLRNRKEIIYNKNVNLISKLIKVRSEVEKLYGEKLNSSSANYNDMVDDIANILSVNGYGTDKDKIRINKNYVIRLLNMMNYASLDNTANIAPSYDDRLATMDNGVEAIIEKDEFESTLYNCLEDLNGREREVLSYKFGLMNGRSKSNEEIAAFFSERSGNYVPWQRIRQIEAKALRKLRNPKRSKRLQPYLH